MSFEIVLGAIALVIAAIAGAFGLGQSKGTHKAEAAADKQRTEENAAAATASAERRVEATKGAADVQQTVNDLPDDDVSRELRESWRKPTSGN
ncbi:hypothetical protein [Dryocola clanedunensis]